jgi:hypothetical protein
MPLLTIFRLLLVAFFVLYLAAIGASGVSPTSPPEVLAYDKWLQEQSTSESLVWGLLVIVGHVLDLAGLVLLFLRRKLGIYLLLAGFVACLGAGPELPYLQSTFAGTLMAFTNIVWGAIVALAFAVPQALFEIRKDV